MISSGRAEMFVGKPDFLLDAFRRRELTPDCMCGRFTFGAALTGRSLAYFSCHH